MFALEITLHPEAGYIFAGCSRPTSFFLQFDGGPYMLRQLRSKQLAYAGTTLVFSASRVTLHQLPEWRVTPLLMLQGPFLMRGRGHIGRASPLVRRLNVRTR